MLVPVIFMLVRGYMLGGNSDPRSSDIINTTVFSIVVTFSIFVVNTILLSAVTRRTEKIMKETGRILTCLTISLITSNLIIFIEWKIFNALFFHVSPESERAHIFENQMLATVLVVIVDLIFEVSHYIKQLKITIAEKERLEKENMRAQLEGLKTQVSPHFLFNSFNALQSLIDSDTNKAKEFLHELSGVYRYVLENNSQMVVEVKSELQFIRSYIYLNQIRFGENLHFETSISADALKKFIPPLTLQMLIENAIKHNIISSSKPLHIQIRSTDDTLVVENNLQLRTERTLSTGIGLHNLEERYFLICHKKPNFTIENNKYLAVVPLIEKEN